jgi:8-oxo-dGTP pyrophosphatase MutT (NUDIX family)
MWYKSIKKELANLPGESAHLEMIPYRLPSSLHQGNYNTAKLAAVMCLLFRADNDIHCILMERTEDGGKHSGQISFPGGKKEKDDLNLEQTALRETHEEIGIHPETVTVLGQLTEVYIPISNFLIKPYVGIINSDFEFNLSTAEVKSAFHFKVSDLLASQAKQSRTIKNHNGIGLKNIPCFELESKIVWGATSLILNELKVVLGRINFT